jgi:hypothetical protein
MVNSNIVEKLEDPKLEFSATDVANAPGSITTMTVLSPDNPPWGAGVAFLTWVASVLFILFVPSFFLVGYVLFSGIKITDPSSLAQLESDPTALLYNLIGIVPAHLLTLALCWLVVTNGRKHSFREMLGWEWGKYGKWATLGGLVVVFFVLILAAGAILKALGQQETSLDKILKSSRYAVFVVAFMATFTAPIVEEVVYRGVLYSAFQRSVGVAGAIGIVTFLFAIVHVPQYYQSIATVLVITLMSLTLTLVRVYTDNLLPAIVLHTIINGVQSAVMVFYPYFENYIPTQETQTASVVFQLLR